MLLHAAILYCDNKISDKATLEVQDSIININTSNGSSLIYLLESAFRPTGYSSPSKGQGRAAFFLLMDCSLDIQMGSYRATARKAAFPFSYHIL